MLLQGLQPRWPPSAFSSSGGSSGSISCPIPAVARAPLGLAPSTGFMKRWYSRSRAVMQQASPLDLAMASWALGRLGAYPPSQWTAEFLIHSKAAIPRLGPHELLLLLLGVSCMERAAQQQQQQGGSQELSSAADGVQQQGEQQQQQQDAQVLQEPQTQQAAAETAITLQQGQQQQQQQQEELLSSASLLHPTDCAMAVYALARLGPASVVPEFAAFWLAQARSQQGSMNSQELASCVWALGRLKLQPPEDWLQQHLSCSAQLAGSMSHQQLAMLLYGCARLQYLPDVLVTAELLMSAAEQLPAFSPHSLALLLHALGLLRLKPNKEWMALALEQARYRFMRFDAQDFCGVLLGLYRMRYHPGQRWLDAYVQALALKTTSVWTVDLAHLLARFGAAVTFCTITIGINGDYANEWFYMEHLEDDEKRVQQLFSQAAQLGIRLQECSVPLQELVTAVASGRQLAILLVDRRKIDPWQAAADMAWNYTTGVTSATGVAVLGR
ncbi:hypothetical protein OEZ86_011699 [Tetradesmus obliquus]|nr:hypothetical protein OEZ86_011699 [Tetradesmus obliquus]